MRVLFLCVHNSARSQMAEGLLRARAGDGIEVLSAGSQPTRVHPLAIRVMQERGIDISRQRSTSVNEFINQSFDYVITLCAEEICPVFPGAATWLHWGLPDPASVEGSEAQRLQAFRRVADELTRRLAEFLPEP